MKNTHESTIMSYDINKCKSYLMKKFPNIKNVRSLKYKPYSSPKRYGKHNPDDYVAIDLNKDYSDFMEIQKTCYDFLGWLVSRIDIKASYKGNNRPYCYHLNEYSDCFEEDGSNKSLNVFLSSNPEIKIFSMIVENKFPKEYVSDKKTMFFHETRKDVIDEILRNGLVPRHDGNFPARINLGRDLIDVKKMVRENYNDGVILKVEVDGIRLFQDQRKDTVVFTLENIAPSKIEIYDINANASQDIDDI